MFLWFRFLSLILWVINKGTWCTQQSQASKFTCGAGPTSDFQHENCVFASLEEPDQRGCRQPSGQLWQLTIRDCHWCKVMYWCKMYTDAIYNTALYTESKINSAFLNKIPNFIFSFWPLLPVGVGLPPWTVDKTHFEMANSFKKWTCQGAFL